MNNKIKTAGDYIKNTLKSDKVYIFPYIKDLFLPYCDLPMYIFIYPRLFLVFSLSNKQI